MENSRILVLIRGFADRVFLYCLYVLLFVTAWAVGYRMSVPYFYWQLLDEGLLRHRLLESILNLHSQPPLLNLFLGLVLKLSDLTGLRAEGILLIVQFVLGGVVVIALYSLARSLVKPRPLLFAVMAVFLLNPFFYDSIFFYFYTLYELVFLSLLALCVYRYLSGSGFRYFALACLLAAGLVYTRSLFHFIWALAGLAILPLFAGGKTARLSGYTPKVVLCITATALLLFAWPLKNYARFGFFGYSSWQGYNISSGLPVASPPLFDIFYRSRFVPLREQERQFAGSFVPAGYASIPALAEVTKPDNSPNWNHYSVIALSKQMGSEAWAAMLDKPSLIISKAYDFYVNGYSIYEGRDPYYGDIGKPQIKPLPGSVGWMKAFETAVFQYRGDTVPLDGPPVPHTGFAYIFPIVILLSIAAIALNWKTDPVGAATAGFLLYCVLWVLLMVLFVDGVEGNRMRFSTEPFTFILAGWSLWKITSRIKAVS